MTASDGEAHEIGPGDVWLMGELSGRGHHTEVTSAEEFEAAILRSG